MKHRKYPEEKPTDNRPQYYAEDDEIMVHCWNMNNSEGLEYLGMLKYKPCYDKFVRLIAGEWMGALTTIEEIIEDVTHFKFNDDLEMPEQ